MTKLADAPKNADKVRSLKQLLASVKNNLSIEISCAQKHNYLHPYVGFNNYINRELLS